MDGTFRKTGIYRRRWQWWFPWSVTDWWQPRLFKGGDEWCNVPACFVVPPIGCIVVFWRPGRLRTMPCPDEWALMADWQRADYGPCGYLHGGRVRQDAHHHVDGVCDDARAWLAAATETSRGDGNAQPASRPACPRCGGRVFYDLTCHTYGQKLPDGTERFMACMPCDSAIWYGCDGHGGDGGESLDNDCEWDYEHGLNPRNPRSAANEANRPPWITGPFDGNAVAGCRMLGTDYVSAG